MSANEQVFEVTNNVQNFPTEFEEVEGGMYDVYGCYIYPDGSFWDPNGVFFNKDGLDANGGFYDEEFVYHPGQNWNVELQCYITGNTELPEEHKEKLMLEFQNRLAEDYDANKELFKTAENENFNIADVEYNGQYGMDIDNDSDLIKSWVDGNLIQLGNSQNEMDQSKFETPKTANKAQNIFESKVMGDLSTPFKTKTYEEKLNAMSGAKGVNTPPKNQF